MLLPRVHAAVRHEPEQMQLAASHARVLHGIDQHGMRKKLAVLNHQIDARDIHVHDAPRADVEVPNLAVPHLAFGQPNKRPRSVNQRVGIVAQQPVVSRLARKCNGVAFGFSAISPAVEDDKDERFRADHFPKSSFARFDRSIFR